MNSMLSSCHGEGKLRSACLLWHEIQCGDSLCTQGPAYVTLLKACAKLKDHKWGLQIHAEIAKAGLLESNLYVGSSLVYMYAKCGSLANACQVFQNLPVRDAVVWTVLLAAYYEYGHTEEALACFDTMDHDKILPNHVTYIWALKACGNVGAMAKGQEIHAEVERRGLCDGKLLVGSTLISMYVKSGSLSKAQEVFHGLATRSVACWTSLLAGYAGQGFEEQALECLNNMQKDGVPPDGFTFACGLKACGSLGATDKGQELHADVERTGMGTTDIFIGNTLVDMYAKWGLPSRAQEVFDKLPVQEVVSWTALISGYTETGLEEEALKLFEQMQIEGAIPNGATYVCILKACGLLLALVKGKEVHTKLEELDLYKGNLLAANSLVDMYAKCGSPTQAQAVFDQVQDPDVVLWTTLIAGYVGKGDAKEALNCFEEMQKRAVPRDVTSFICSLKACGSLGLTEKGRELHSETEKCCFMVTDTTVSNVLVDMYIKCGKLEDAQAVFDRIIFPNVISWNTLLTGYVDYGRGNEALQIFEQMQQKQTSPNILTYVCSLKACSIVGCTDVGRMFHVDIEKKGYLKREDIVGNALVDMYAKCDSLTESKLVFDRLSMRDVVSWNSLIGGYVEHGHYHEALQLVELMPRHGIIPNVITYLCSLKACTSLAAIEKGHKLHNDIEKSGLLVQDPTIGSAVVDMFAKCGLLAKAMDVFNKIQVKDVVSWTALIAGYADQGSSEKALDFFDQMQSEGVSPNAATFVSSLKACGNTGAIKRGVTIHAEVERRGILGWNLMVGNAVVDMYVKCGLLGRAWAVFDKLLVRNVVSWTSLIAGYAEYGPEEEALKCLELMQLEGVSSDSLTLACCLKACGSLQAIAKGQEIHAEVERKGLSMNTSVIHHALVEMYIKCGSLNLAEFVFDKLVIHDVPSWIVLISGYVEFGHLEEALENVERMHCEGLSPNSESLICTLKACGIIGALEKGCELHTLMDRRDHLLNNLVGNTLLDMYAKFGEISKVGYILDNMFVQDVGSWTALIARYVEHGYGEEALRCFEQMQLRKIFPNCITYIRVLKACGMVGAVIKGQQMHSDVEKEGHVGSNSLIGNTLVNMYASWGSLTEAECVFEKLPNHDTVSWNALMAGYAEIGESGKAFSRFRKMLINNVQPDPVTFLVLLNACNRTYMLNESQRLIEFMSTQGFVPRLDHLTGVIDLFCRSGQIQCAIELVRKSPLCSNEVAWRTVLSLCRNWGNVALSKKILKHVFLSNAKGGSFSVDL